MLQICFQPAIVSCISTERYKIFYLCIATAQCNSAATCLNQALGIVIIPAGNLIVFRIFESCQTCFFQDARLRSEPEDHVEGRVEAPLLRQVVVLSKTFGRRVPAHPQTRDLKP